METAQIISTITERLGETPLSSRSISDIINANLPATGTEPDEAYFTNLVTMLKTFGSVYQGQHNHDTATARKSWEEEWTKTHPTTPPSGGLTEEKIAEIIARQLAANKPQTDPALAQMQQQLTQMQQQMTAREDAAKIAAIKDGIKAQLMNLNDVNEGILSMAIQNTEVKADSKAEDVLKAVKEQYEVINKSIFGNSATPLGGGQGGNGSGVADYLKKLQEEQTRMAEARRAAAGQYK